ncbi:hypothetical protein LOTGIDRAFT_118765 [Lottia gigantea]|uniref:GPR180/TMEM145 transmembrane domain-containing protein n=1 Tax=Lottia gigantea TaxID=225164 RepID=V3ZS49_LOTGI|nr:hypothetical protein LOTGIDRAFT_118765 [Lottia gigantea]ESO94273.1 hypothetical protein LOTGIDRAFT_118765 [Lottia gigantea]
MKIVRTFLVSHIFTFLTIIHALRLQGTMETRDYFRFLSKFGFQKTDQNNGDQTQGYVYGNITSRSNKSSSMILVVVDSEYFKEFYGNQTHSKNSCQKSLNKINTIAFDAVCFPNGPEDFLRRVPCPRGMVCADEDTPENVIKGYQFTYRIRDYQRPRYWFLSIVSCQLDRGGSQPSCQWHDTSSDNVTIDYDIWLVNGDPDLKHYNPFEHQFSFEMHDVFEIHLTALVICVIILPMWIYVYLKQKHAITQILSVCIGLQMSGIAANFLYVLLIAILGTGYTYLAVTGNFLALASQCFFVLFLIFIAKGWGITTDALPGKIVMYIIWGFYTILNIVLFVWNLILLDPVINTDKWQTYPGYLTLAFRLVIMIWFLYELRKTSQKGHHLDRLQFFQHFGAFFLVWFVYLPALVLICSQISALWRYKTILSISYAAEILGYIVLIHLLWPSRSVLYLINGEVPLQTWDLEITG